MSDGYQIKNQEGLYFITCQVVGWVDVFSRQKYRDFIIDSLKFCQANKDLIIYSYVIMTNHVHLIIRSDNGRLSDVLRDFKRFTSNMILTDIEFNSHESRRDWMDVVFRYHGKYNTRVENKQFWTHESHPVELTNNVNIDTRVNYIHENPVRAGWVENAWEYLYSSARNYAGMKGLLKVEMV